MKTKQEILKECYKNSPYGSLNTLYAVEAMEIYANQSRWISVDERLPEVKKGDIRVWIINVLVGNKKEVQEAYIYNDVDSKQLCIDGFKSYCIRNEYTHWQELPKNPE